MSGFACHDQTYENLKVKGWYAIFCSWSVTKVIRGSAIAVE